MLISYKWLQTYFTDPLPTPEVLADLLTFHVFEIEGIQKTGTDTVIDVKVLPDRAHYALSHRGMAYEVAAITGLSTTEKAFGRGTSNLSPLSITSTKEVVINNTEPELCFRYSARYIENVTVTDSPEWLIEFLRSIGQRPINNVVDATNFTMFDCGQPLHAFDADLLVGGITIRKAKAGEKMTTLDNKELSLDESILIIADDKGPLAVAGVKGGNRAGVTPATKNLIIESATFSASMVRKTSQKIGIRTDSSKRFENEITPAFAEIGMADVTTLIHSIANAEAIGPVTDIYPKPVSPTSIAISASHISDRLGVAVTDEEITTLLKRLFIEARLQADGLLLLTIPLYRLDLTIAQDIVEEVGRLYGYDKIPSNSLPQTSFGPTVTKELYYANKIRTFLTQRGFSEVYTYSLTDKKNGSVELLNPMASDKNMLRESLAPGIAQSLILNTRNAPLLGLNEIKIFEIGTVFSKEGESTELCLGISLVQTMKNKDAVTTKMLMAVVDEILSEFGTTVEGQIIGTDRYILNFSEIVSELPVPKAYEFNHLPQGVKIFSSISPYPFITRDIAVFTPIGTSQADVEKIISDNAGPLMVRTSIFDIFEKTFPDGTKKTSYGFRLVFQSHERTLTDAEVNDIMQTITAAMHAESGWQVR